MLSVEVLEDSSDSAIGADAPPLSFKRHPIEVGADFVVFNEEGDEIDCGIVECVRYRLDGTAFAFVDRDGRVYQLTPDADVTFYPGNITEVSCNQIQLVFGLMTTPS